MIRPIFGHKYAPWLTANQLGSDSLAKKKDNFNGSGISFFFILAGAQLTCHSVGYCPNSTLSSVVTWHLSLGRKMILR